MRARMLVLIIMGITACSSLVANANVGQGFATYYNPPYVPSACYGYQNNGVMVAGVSPTLWGNKAACGKTYKVTCIGSGNADPHPCIPGASVVVKVVDYCPGCPGPINLSKDAFAVIANPAAGKIVVSYSE
ncbi:hypothetical protein Vadar_004135 [Vaccinium darrowii]|uniref:Uncharacterized protein n=1 Tax=Vaccinium darrowii TaxID=229202 RepID=A0ACB7Z1K1_9ERIC|nr:hypothetical protein Vadar_004135 [Vaccinium darrowii]